MKTSIAAIAIATLAMSSAAFGQASQATPRGAMSSPNAQGVQIQGNTDSACGVAVGKNNDAGNSAGTIGGK